MKKGGFTIIETLVYIVIFSIILTAGIASAYNLIEGTNRFNQKVLVESEANFVLRKLSLSLENVTAVTVPNPQTLTITRSLGATTEDLIFTESSGQMLLQRDGGTPLPLTTSRVIVSNFLVNLNDNPSDGKAGSVTVSFEVNGKSFSMMRILRTDTT